MNLANQLLEDCKAHGWEWTRPGLHAVIVHRLGNAVRRIPVVRSLVGVARVWCRNVYGIELPVEATIGRRVVIYHQGGIVVHGRARIGDDCVLRQGVTLGIRRMDRLDDAPRLGRGVQVGAGAKILGAVTVGDRAEIGANSVVLRDVPAGGLAVGIPARTIRRGEEKRSCA